MTRSRGRFGDHGGQYIPETLMNAVIELEEAYNRYKDDPEFNEFFGDPNKSWDGPYQFVRDYERALTKKKERSAQNPQTQGNVAGLPSMSGVGKKSTAIPNTMKSSDIYDQWVAEMRNQR